MWPCLLKRRSYQTRDIQQVLTYKGKKLKSLRCTAAPTLGIDQRIIDLGDNHANELLERPHLQ